jgi:hypothetical protein
MANADPPVGVHHLAVSPVESVASASELKHVTFEGIFELETVTDVETLFPPNPAAAPLPPPRDYWSTDLKSASTSSVTVRGGHGQLG